MQKRVHQEWNKQTIGTYRDNQEQEWDDVDKAGDTARVPQDEILYTTMPPRMVENKHQPKPWAYYTTDKDTAIRWSKQNENKWEHGKVIVVLKK